MNIKNKVRSAKCGVLGALVAVGLSAFADPSVTVNKVESADPWDSTRGTITVNYTLGGVDAKLDYKVAFDVTAGGQTASVTNAAAKLTDGAATKEIDTATLFGKEVVDTQAKVKVSLIAIKPKTLGGVQLWANGPFFAECNVGAEKPTDYGWYFWWGDTVGYTHDGNKWVSVVDGTTSIQFGNSDPANSTFFKEVDTLKLEGWIDDSDNLVASHDAATAKLGAPWRMMTKGELDKLVSADYCQSKWVTEYNGVTVSGYVVKGKAGSAYENNEVFFPAAGEARASNHKYDRERGRYWASTPDLVSYDMARCLSSKSDAFTADTLTRYYGLPVRAVRDAE